MSAALAIGIGAVLLLGIVWAIAAWRGRHRRPLAPSYTPPPPKFRLIPLPPAPPGRATPDELIASLEARKAAIAHAIDLAIAELRADPAFVPRGSETPARGEETA